MLLTMTMIFMMAASRITTCLASKPCKGTACNPDDFVSFITGVEVYRFLAGEHPLTVNSLSEMRF